MKLRALTGEEKRLVNQAKERIKEFYEPIKAEARRQRVYGSSRSIQDRAEDDLKALRRLPGAPVRLYDSETFAAVVVDYDTVRQLLRTFDEWWAVELTITRNQNGKPALQVRYWKRREPAYKGQALLWGLPFNGQEALQQLVLPAIDIRLAQEAHNGAA